MVNELKFNSISQKVNDISDALSIIKESGPTTSASNCAEYYRMVREMHDSIDELKKKAYDVMNYYAMDILPKLFDQENVSTITLTSGYRVTIRDTLRASISAENKPAAYQWLMNNDLGDLITETVNASSLSATARHLIEEGRQLPDDLFKTVLLPQVSMTKVK